MPDVAAYKSVIAKAIIFKTTQKMVRPLFPAFQANVVAYTVSVLAHRLGKKLDLDGIWLKQSISPSLQEQIKKWAMEVNDMLHQSAGGRMISEWAKKPECWDTIMEGSLSQALTNILEAR